MAIERQTYFAIGLMSGTSLDGVDAALVDTDGEIISAFGPSMTMAYAPELRERLRSVMINLNLGEMLLVERELTIQHAEIVRALLKKADVPADEVGVIGFHGQTLFHAPEHGVTCQIGNPSLLAANTGINVVADFRRMDMAYGGQGAPMTPLFHLALAKDLPKPLAILNIGGVANVTWIGENNQLAAFDTGPGNALINDFMQYSYNTEYDKDGQIASSGTVDEEALGTLMEHPFFEKVPPKSLDRNEFIQLAERIGGLDKENAVATLTEYTALCVAVAKKHFPEPPKSWIVCGGGRHNPVMMQALNKHLEAEVKPCEEMGWNGDALEAQAFAYLALRSMRSLPLSLPDTTGASLAATGGAFYRALSGVAE